MMTQDYIAPEIMFLELDTEFALLVGSEDYGETGEAGNPSNFDDYGSF